MGPIRSLEDRWVSPSTSHTGTLRSYVHETDSSDHIHVIAGLAGGQLRYGNTASTVIGLFWCGLLH
ncbi:hypothetical protein J6590_007781 [Homalodisca vitripennis]|nr:hypothetical protein J6590_007781 [Homalodisca vitripennis]